MADREKELQVKLTFKDELSSQVQSVTSKVKEHLGTISAAAGVALAGMAAFAVKTVKDAAESAEAIDNLSKSTGLAVHQVAALKLASDQTSVPLETITGAVKKLQINMTNMSEDTKKAQETFKVLGLNFNDVAKQSPANQLFTIGNAIANIKDPAQRTATAVKVLGKAGADLAPLFGKGTMSMQDWIDKSEELGVSLDEVGVERAAAADQAFDDLDAQLQGLTLSISRSLTPVIVNLLEAIIPVVEQVGVWIGDNPELVKQIVLWGGAILSITAALGPLSTAIGLVSKAVAFLAANPIVLVVAAIVGLIAYLVNLYKTNEDFRKKVDEVWNKVKDTVMSVYNNYLKPAFVWLTETLPKNISQGWEDIKTSTTNTWNSIKNFLTDNVIKPIQDAFQKFNDFMKPLWDALWKFYQVVLQPIITFMGNLLKQFFDDIVAKFTAGAAILKGIWEVLWKAISAVAPPIWEGIKSMASAVGENLAFIFNTIKGVLVGIWDGLWGTIKSIVTSARDTIIAIINTITGAVEAIPNAVNGAVNYVKSIPSKISNVGKSISDSIYSARKTYLGYADGGDPPVGVPSIVGERGPELFVPKTAGTIIPNENLGGRTIVVNITGNNLWDRNAAEKLLDMATRKFFLTNKVN